VHDVSDRATTNTSLPVLERNLRNIDVTLVVTDD
jgi:hypothetical protein